MKIKFNEQYVNTKVISETWGISQRKVTKYCREKLIPKAYKDKKSKTWQIPYNSIKPLENKELIQLLFLMLKIQNYLVIDSNYINEAQKSFQDMSPAIKYLENFGYIRFKDNDNKLNNIIFTDKSYDAINRGRTITINSKEIFQIISSVIQIAFMIYNHLT